MTLIANELTVEGRLQSASAHLQAGQVTAICGPNGAGKSSLLSVLAGLLNADSGEVLLDGLPLSSLKPELRAQKLGYLPQSADVAWDVSVRNLVALGRMPHRDADAVANAGAVDRAIETLDLARLTDRPMSRLSGGEKARALLARVLAGEPEWILADEPLAALDIAHQLALIGHLRDCAGQGTGVVIVVHDLALAMNHAHRVLVLDKGRIVADGAADIALAEDMISKVWGIQARWSERGGTYALMAER